MSIERGMDKEVAVNIYNGILVIKKNKILPFTATWTDLENMLLGEINPTDTDKYCVISFIQ